MTAGHPLRPLVDLGEALNGLAPHNVLASLVEGSNICTTPAMGRQPTMYEEMQRVVPQKRPAPAATAAPQAFDPLAPLNAILAFLSGGQAPPTGFQAPGIGETLQKFAKASGSQYGNPVWVEGGMGIVLAHQGDKVSIAAPSDRDIVVEEQDMEHLEIRSEKKDWMGNWVETGEVEKMPDYPSGAPQPRTINKGQSMSFVLKTDISDRSVGPEAGTYPLPTARKVTYKNHDKYIRLKFISPVATAPNVPGAPVVPGAPKAPGVPPPQTFTFEGRQYTLEQALARAQNLEATGDFESAAELYNLIGRPDLASAVLAKKPSAPTVPGAPEVPTEKTFSFEGVKYTYDQALQRAQFLELAGKYDEAAKLYNLIGESQMAQEARAKMPSAPAGPVANFYYRGKYYTKDQLLSMAASYATNPLKVNEAIDIYDMLGESGKANALRDRLANEQASAQQAQQEVMNLLAQARMFEAQGRFREAAELYKKAGYPNLADSALKKASTAEQKASAKAKAEEIARAVAAAKLAAAKKKK